MSGDDYLSGMDHRLWQLHRHIIFKYGVYTLYKWDRWNCVTGEKGLIRWMVPKYADQCYEIVKFLEYELESEKYKGDDILPGRDVEVSVCVDEYKGIDFYMEKDEREKLALEAMNDFQEWMKDRKEKDSGSS